MKRKYLIIKHSLLNRNFEDISKNIEEIENIVALSSEQEIEIFKRINKGDYTAFEELINANLKYVISVARQFQNNGLSFPKLIKAGNTGLVEAVEGFDNTRGFRFIAHAFPLIRNSILQELTKNSQIKKIGKDLYRLKGEVDKLKTIQDETSCSLDIILKDLVSFNDSSTKKNQDTISFIFNTSEFNVDDISEVLILFSELYNSIGGDELEIKKIVNLDFKNALQPNFS